MADHKREIRKANRLGEEGTDKILIESRMLRIQNEK